MLVRNSERSKKIFERLAAMGGDAALVSPAPQHSLPVHAQPQNSHQAQHSQHALTRLHSACADARAAANSTTAQAGKQRGSCRMAPCTCMTKRILAAVARKTCTDARIARGAEGSVGRCT